MSKQIYATETDNKYVQYRQTYFEKEKSLTAPIQELGFNKIIGQYRHSSMLHYSIWRDFFTILCVILI